MKSSILILSFFIAGILVGKLITIPELFIDHDISLYVLYFLMLLVGIGIGSDKNAFKTLRSINYKILLIPLISIAGTFFGIVLHQMIFSNFSWRQSLAVGSGFGYYSLSSVLLSEMGNETLGVVSLISNIGREVLTLVLAPLFVFFFGKIAPIAAGGATSMDVTLPVIIKFSGKEYSYYAIFNGIILTILVPLIISLLY